MTPAPRRAAEVLERLAANVADTTPVGAQDRAELDELLPLILSHARQEEVRLDDERLLALAVHSLAFVRRVRDRESLPELDGLLYEEVPSARLTAARRLVDAYCAPRSFTPPDSEVLLFALHFEVAHASASETH
ncbi:hypothetical protein [Streptomyces reniochalinae]|uniref:PRD domain-containing protein n=1 Tax=Streptomyces reniochalinae TaxID=2250578 RepID=A0A367EIQ0_9ACTN|nr:hypothetical protein [Streptomyces reniochalinae]RCG17515.1 hypothetical protein DQ392_16715 [Streptomyces reniochalinae]